MEIIGPFESKNKKFNKKDGNYFKFSKVQILKISNQNNRKIAKIDNFLSFFLNHKEKLKFFKVRNSTLFTKNRQNIHKKDDF